MIRIYGGNVTAGAQDGIEVGTEENPILFDGLYPAFNGSTSKNLNLAIRTDGESINDVCIMVAMLNDNSQELNPANNIIYTFYSYPDKTVKLNEQTLLFNYINNKNKLFTIKANAKGSEDTNISPDMRGKLYVFLMPDIFTILS